MDVTINLQRFGGKGGLAGKGAGGGSGGQGGQGGQGGTPGHGGEGGAGGMGQTQRRDFRGTYVTHEGYDCGDVFGGCDGDNTDWYEGYGQYYDDPVACCQVNLCCYSQLSRH